MRIAVFGAGAVGSLLGARLSGTADVVLIARGAHLRAIRRGGLRIEGQDPGTFKLKATDKAEAARDADLVLLTTKAYDTPAAAKALRAARVRAPVLSLQNGLTNLPVLRRELKGSPLLGGSLVVGVTRLGPGKVRHAGGPRAVVGLVRGAPRVARNVADAFSKAEIPTTVTRDLNAVLWEKAIVNAAVNPITAVLRCANGDVLDRHEARLIAQLATLEAAAVARVQGIRVAADPWAVVEQVLLDTAENRSSMLQDIEAGRRTEVDAITGEIVRMAARSSVSVPVNRALLALVEAL